MQEIVGILTELMRYRTTADRPEEIRRCADYIIKYLSVPGIIVREYMRNGKISIVALFRETKSPKIFLNAHFDVVPASSHFYEPYRKGDKLYGRGSEDCKSQVASLMHLMRCFSKEKPDIGIMLTSDEEVHGENGVQHLINKEHYSCKFALVSDGGDDWNIITRHKGVLQVRLSAVGKSAHASRYWEGGENAIEKLIDAYAKVKKIFPKLAKAEWKTTASLSKISGGDTINKVPDYAELYLDIRRTEKDTEKALLKKLNSLKGIEVEVIAAADNLETNPDNKYIKQLRKSAEKILRRKIKLYHEHGATDARYFSASGIPAVLFKPLGFGAHSEDEHVIVSSLRPYFRILADFVKSA